MSGERGSYPQLYIVIYALGVSAIGHRLNCLFRGNTMKDIQKRKEQTDPKRVVRRNRGLHVTCLTTISTGREALGWVWSGREIMDAHAVIGSSRLPIFRLVSCPSLVCVQLYFGMRGKMSGLLPLSTSHHGNSLRARSLALKHTLLCHLLAVSVSLSPLDRFTCRRNWRPWKFCCFSWACRWKANNFSKTLLSICFYCSSRVK